MWFVRRKGETAENENSVKDHTRRNTISEDKTIPVQEIPNNLKNDKTPDIARDKFGYPVRKTDVSISTDVVIPKTETEIVTPDIGNLVQTRPDSESIENIDNSTVNIFDQKVENIIEESIDAEPQSNLKTVDDLLDDIDLSDDDDEEFDDDFTLDIFDEEIVIEGDVVPDSVIVDNKPKAVDVNYKNMAPEELAVLNLSKETLSTLSRSKLQFTLQKRHLIFKKQYGSWKYEDLYDPDLDNKDSIIEKLLRTNR